MKNKIKYVSLVVVSFILLFTTTTMAAQTSEQTSVTQQQSFAKVKGKVNKSNVKKGDTFKYSITITNTGLEKLFFEEYDIIPFSETKEIGEVVLVWQSSGKQTMEYSYTGKYNKKTKKFKITDEIKITKGMQQGTWKLKKIILFSDESYTEDDCMPAFARIYNKNIVKKTEDNSSDNYEKYVDLSFADFTVRGTGKKIDKSGPTISPKSMKLSKKTMKENQKSKFSVKVTDQGKIKEVICNWETRSWNTLYTMKYNKKKKVYECNVAFEGADKMKLHSIRVTDIYGNCRDYSDDSDGGFKKIRSTNRDFNGKYKHYKMSDTYKKAFKRMVVKKKK